MVFSRLAARGILASCARPTWARRRPPLTTQRRWYRFNHRKLSVEDRFYRNGWLILLPVVFGSLLVDLNGDPYVLNEQQVVVAEQVLRRKSGVRSVAEMRRRYKLGKVLGEGTFAVVRMGFDRVTKSRVAVKEIRKDLSDESALQNEVDIMKMTGKHDNIISLIEIFDSEDTMYLVMDLAEGGELFDKIIEQGELSEQTASFMMKEAMLATKHLHDNSIVHLDIKPENLLLTKKSDGTHIKLADFGLALCLDDDRCENKSECVGTPAYWAPELVRNEPFGYAVDIWALGCVLYIMLCGSHPFDPYGDDPEAVILARVADGDYDVANKQYAQISGTAKDLLRHMLDPCPIQRYSAKQALEHPWISEPDHLSPEPLPSSNIAKLKGFRAIHLLRTGMENMLNDPKICETMFDSFDADGDGFLTRGEFEVAMKSLGLYVSDKELDEMLAVFDANKDGKISRAEFDSTMTSQIRPDKFAKASIKEIELLFNIFDRDKDGYIEKKDFQHVLGLIGSGAPGSVLFKHVTPVTNHSDGLVDFAEFAQFYRRLEEERMEQGIIRGASIHIKKKRTIGRS